MGKVMERATTRRSRLMALLLLCVATVFIAGAIAAPSLASALSISGKVTGASGRVIEDATVSAYYYDRSDQEWYEEDTDWTNEFGNYSITGLTEASSYVLMINPDDGVHAPQFYNGKSTFASADRITTTKTGLNIQVAVGGVISGRALDTSSRPISDIGFMAYDPNSDLPAYRFGVSNRSGDFRVEGLPTGSYILNGWDSQGSEFEDQYYNGQLSSSRANRISVTQGNTAANITMRMLRVGETPSLANAVVTLPQSLYTYTGGAIAPAPVVAYNGAALIAGLDYTVSYTNNVNTGFATVTVNGAGAFTGAKIANFTIGPKKAALAKITSPKTKQLKATWKKDAQATGYQVQVSLKKNFKSGTKAANISKNKTTSSLFKGLKAKKTYYVHVRAYKTINGTKVYGDWSPAKKIKIK